MKHQLSIAREGIEAAIASDAFLDKPVRRALLDALTALSELERLAGEPDPDVVIRDGAPTLLLGGRVKDTDVRLYRAAPPAQQPHDHVAVTWDAARTRILAVTLQDAEGRVLCVIDEAPAQQPQYEAGDMASAHNDGFRAGVASVAQQPQSRPDFTDEWTGYLKDGETPFERFMRERKDLGALTKLYQRALEENERLKAQQPQAQAVLRKLEWAEVRHEYRESEYVCPICDRDKRQGHEPGCELAAALAPQQAEAVPPTHVLVPVEPTPEMLEAAIRLEADTADAFDDDANHSEIYRAMIDAAMKQGGGV